ncbi:MULTISPECIES: hypothetical protein [unclassified Pseudanabaena]|uniref:hypothetical protein n=1 Tax=unclassified Pseudanabaena TaxID=2593292 RepID=UPI0006D80D13|nr:MULTISPECIES: hypothetical protein [unclassified Pseudanabaena]TYQ26422.1 hypothetical protein PseudUWO310_17505 [Pseudanabaena sp. UWO310]
MTIESILTTYKIPVLLLIFLSPWIAYYICLVVPGTKEEPYVLSVNLSLSALVSIVFAGYIAYASNTGGWGKIGKEADILLLASAPYHVISSIVLAKKRMPLSQIPAFKLIQGLVLMSLVFMFISWLSSRIHLYFFSYLPFSYFLMILAVALLLGYVGYTKVFGED